MTTLKKKISLIFGLVIATMVGLTAQDFQGTAIYQSARKTEGFTFKAEGMTPQMEAQIMEQMKKRFQKEYELKFNVKESIWKEVESLGASPSAGQSSGGVMIQVASSGGNGVTYKNTAKGEYLKEQDVFGKQFLVKDELETRGWEITSETKQIGNYTAMKAIFTDTQERRTISFTSSDSDDDKEDGEPELTTVDVKIEAWYTPQIPVSHGPEDYWGLPGLILEVTNGTTSYVCTKLVLNPNEEVVIKAPKKGKKVNRDELQEAIEAKMEEMSNKFSSGGRGSGTTIRFGTGGE